MLISKALEEYVKAMYVLKNQTGEIRVTDIANKMNVSKASVNKSLKTLKEEGFVDYESYGTIELNNKSTELAKKLLEAYDIAFLFFHEVLEMEEDISKIEAEKLKSTLSDESLNKLARFVHKELNLSSLDCDYDINNERCRECTRRKV